MTRVVAALEELELVQRDPHLTDGRQSVIVLTDRGRDLLAEDRKRRQAWLACRLKELSPGEREALAGRCSDLREARGFVKRTFRSLRIRNYRLFAGGQLVSLTGSWMQRVGQDWLVLRLSHNSGFAIGVTTGLQFLPLLLFGLQGGVIADRFSKRKLILATQVSMCLLALGLGLLDLLGAATLLEVYLFAFLLGLATAVDNPTRQAFVAELVGGEELPNAVGLNSATFNARPDPRAGGGGTAHRRCRYRLGLPRQCGLVHRGDRGPSHDAARRAPARSAACRASGAASGRASPM